MPERTITYGLIALVALLAILGAKTHDGSVLTMAAAALTGLFAWLQVPR
jgi:hypothetical protein